MTKKKVLKEEAAVVCPVDPYVEKDYFEALNMLERLVIEGKSNLF